ncbi:MAG: hypothetical protein ACOY7J_08655 [Pseudomonadota bacterium]
MSKQGSRIVGPGAGKPDFEFVRAGMGDPGIFGFNLGVKRFSLLHSATAQIFQQAHCRAFCQIQ